MTSYYIGYDCGTMGTKVAIYSLEGELVSEAYREHVIKYPKPSWAEMEPQQFYKCVTEGIRECMQKSGLKPDLIRGISDSGVICGILPIDDDWRPVTPYIPFLDNRATAEVEDIMKNAEPLWAEEAGNSEVAGYMPPMVLKWFQKNDKAKFKSIKKTMAASQYVMGILGGLKAKDAFIDWGHLTGWVLGYKLKTRNWSERQIDILGLPYEILPRVVKPWDVVGYLTKNEAEKIGLKEGIPLVAGSGDVMQSNLGSGVTEDYACADLAGTASIFTMLLGEDCKKITDTKTLVTGFSTLDKQYLYFGFIPAGGLSLRWFRDEILREPGNQNSYDVMNKLAENIPMGSDGVLFYPYLQGKSSPAWPNANGTWLGLYGSNSLANLYKSIMESIAFEYLSYSKIFSSHGIDIKSLTIIGGGSKSDMWNQMKADVLNTECRILKRSDGAALANAALAAYGVGDISDLTKTIHKWVETKKIYKPIKSNHDAYMDVFETREEILNGPLVDIFEKLAKLRAKIIK
jgi:xylulokinase